MWEQRVLPRLVRRANADVLFAPAYTAPLLCPVPIVVTIHDCESRKQNFGQVRNSFIRIYDEVSNEEICKYELDEDFSIETAVEFGRLYKRGGEWKFEAVGKGFTGGLEFLVGKYV